MRQKSIEVTLAIWISLPSKQSIIQTEKNEKTENNWVRIVLIALKVSIT